MVVFTKQALLVGLQLLGLAASAALDLSARSVASDLHGLLSASSSIDIAARERWNEVDAPVPAVVVSPLCEKDIKTVVKYCAENNLPLVPQNGGNGWASFNLDGTAVILNLSRLNQVTVSADKQTATIGGGAIIEEVVAAADAAGVLVMTGNCNCVGALGAGLGGGFGNLVGELGMGVDNILSLRVVTPDGEAIDVSPTSNPDLFWAMRGAGPNFGVVTYATVKAVPTEDRNAFLTAMTFEGSQVQEVAQAIQDLTLLPNQVVFFIFGNTGDAANTPTVLVTGFLRGADEAEGAEAFAPIIALGPTSYSGSVAPYTSWNAANDFFCARGERKPAFSTAIPTMNGSDWSAVWDLYTDFQKNPGAENSAVLIEVYNYDKTKSVGLGATAVSDELRFNSFAQAVVIPWYKDAALDPEALNFASQVRDIWALPAGGKTNPAYINFAHGDEDLSAIYGSSLPRLQELKAQYDPQNVFGHWFSLA